MARKLAWDHALDYAINVSYTNSRLPYHYYFLRDIVHQHSAFIDRLHLYRHPLCRKGLVRETRAAFDVASMFTDQDSKTGHFLLLIKVGQIRFAYSLLHSVFQSIALFNADQHEEAILLIQELAAACLDVDHLGCRVVEVSVVGLRLIIDADLCNSHIRYIHVFGSEPKPWVMRLTTKPLTTSLLLSTPALSRRNVFMKYTRRS
jgi:hypothetical protein